jgi:glutathione S-transferase
MALIENPKNPLVAKLQDIHLFHFDGAPCAQRVRFALGEKGLARSRDVPWASDAPQHIRGFEGGWVSRPVSLIKKEHVSEAYAQIQPNMVVPALVHDGQLHIESMEIIDYLDHAFPDNPLRPVDPTAAALSDEMVDLGKKLHVAVRYVNFHWGLGSLAKLGSKAEARLKTLEKDGSPEKLFQFYSRYDKNAIEEETYLSHLRDLEAGYAKCEALLTSDGRAFLTGDTFSTADIIWSIKVLRIFECGYPFAQNFPALFEWFQRVSQRPAFQTSVMSHHKLMSRAFRLKAGAEKLLGYGLARVAAKPSVGRTTAA